MNLKDFVSESLIEIFEGVKDAQSRVGQGLGEINPSPVGSHTEFTKQGLFMAGDRKIGTHVEFDVAVTVSEGSGSKGGIGIFSGAINIGASGQSNKTDVSLSRIKFQVPIVLPYEIA